ncbi:MAG: mechanosensitive ion channel family protein [Halodesulfurarchaeum sp.]
MTRRLGLLSLALAFVLAVSAVIASQLWAGTAVGAFDLGVIASKLLAAASVVAGMYGLYRIVRAPLLSRAPTKRRQHDVAAVLRLSFGAIGVAAVFGILTQQWVGLLVSLGVVGFAITFALQQPLFSLIGWLYIMVERPYQVGDRVAIEGSKGDVVSVGFLVTTLWEIDGDLVSSNQPSGRIITLPNSVVLSSHVHNYTRETFPYVWNELAVQVAYETDLSFAIDEMIAVADERIGEEMAERIAEYRRRLAETPVELEVRDRPTVNVVQTESWVELRLRYLVSPKRGQRVRNELYRAILERFNEHPDRVKFPVGRNR